MIGREKPERKMSKNELERVSKHEAGHALMSYVLKNCEPPVKVSILPRGEAALGFSQQKPDDKKLYTQYYVLSQICVLLGGRSAEKIFYQELSSGAHDDIEKVTQLMEHYYQHLFLMMLILSDYLVIQRQQLQNIQYFLLNFLVNHQNH